MKKYTVVFYFPHEIKYPHIEASNSEMAVGLAFEHLTDYIPDVYVQSEDE